MWGKNRKENGCVYTYDGVALLYSGKGHNFKSPVLPETLKKTTKRPNLLEGLPSPTGVKPQLFTVALRTSVFSFRPPLPPDKGILLFTVTVFLFNQDTDAPEPRACRTCHTHCLEYSAPSLATASSSCHPALSLNSQKGPQSGSVPIPSLLSL